jgi:hypothetical protein
MTNEPKSELLKVQIEPGLLRQIGAAVADQIPTANSVRFVLADWLERRLSDLQAGSRMTGVEMQVAAAEPKRHRSRK